MARADWEAGMSSSSAYSICFHAQQAAEKNLKAYLAAAGLPTPRTHDLLVLLRAAAKRDPSFESLQAQAAVLAPFAVKIRYSESKSVADLECKAAWDAMTSINCKVHAAVSEFGLGTSDA